MMAVSSSGRKSGWAILASARARSRRVSPLRRMAPYSVAMYSTSFRLVVTVAHAERVGTMRDFVPSLAVDVKAKIDRPFFERFTPRR